MFDALFEALFTYRPVVFQQGEFRFDVTTASLVAAIVVGAVVAVAVLTYRRVRVNEGRLRDRIVLTSLRIAAWNGGAHVAPTFAGDTLRAFTQVVERAEVPGRTDCGALRLKLSAVKNVSAADLPQVPSLMSGTKDGRIVLELDYWALLPRR